MTATRSISIGLFFAILTFDGIAQPAGLPLPEGAVAHGDLAYVSNGHERQKLDLYLPEEGTNLPLIVNIHGGAFRAGSKEQGVPLAYLREGYAVASINYRLSQHAKFPAQIEDCKAAVRWLRAHAGEYRLDPNRFAAWGPSAGGYLAALLGTTGDTKEFDVGTHLDQSSRVQAVVPEIPGLQLWSVDALVKVFPGDKPGTATPAVVEVARGEHASFQVVVYSESEIQSLQATMATLKRAGAAEDALAPLPPRFVGYVPVDRPTQTPSKDQLRKPPADYPDPLLESPTLDVPAGRAQAVWVTVPVPTNASPGTYQGILTITGTVGGKRVSVPHELALTVHGAVVGASRLWVTQWFALHWRHMEIAPQPESEDYYALLRRYARNLAEHRHNVALISPLALARYTVGSNGLLAIDFSRFDRWVQIFKEEGVVGRIEGGHIGGRKGGWESEFVVTVHQVKEGKVASSGVDPSSPEADAFYARFFPALMAHLREKGWQECYLQHLADEPIAANISSYRAMAALARQYAPGLRIVEACHTKDLVGAIDVWVPQLNYLHQDFAHYQQRQRAGDEVWLYTCVFPQGEYANRFIEQPLLKTRLLHWINFRYGVTGYLHWGYNHWTQESPFTHTTRAHGGPPYLPAGDPWIVYPGKAGPLDSIRFEAMRDGIADYELLCLLAEKNPDAARRLVGQHVLDFDRYDTDVGKFRAARRELLQLVGQSGCR